MSRSLSLKVRKWISNEELKERIRKKEKDVKVLNRLHFINQLYNGCSVPEASEKLGITKQTGYIWLERWNEDGYEGLIPRFSGGRPSKITDQ
jgi:putative transposase